jgi:hypothetical protein
MMDRRDFLKAAAAAILFRGSGKSAAEQAGAGESSVTQFIFTQLKYQGGDWDPQPLAITPLIEELVQRTSVESPLARHALDLRAKDLFSYPFLYLTGKYEFQSFQEQEISVLRKFLTQGGFLLADDALATPGYGFDRSLRALAEKIFPNQELARLPWDHAVFKSYYLIRQLGGRKLASPYLEGITLDRFTPLIYCQNDLGGAWARDRLGQWINACTPGGEEQRREAFKLGVNVILYAMTENYKDDLIHHPFIRKRLNMK